MGAVVSQPMVGQVLCSSSTKYTIIEFIGEGCYGKVAKCQVNSTSDVVAVKILNDMFVEQVEQELYILSQISTLNPDHFNLVKFYERFECMRSTCLVFELLQMNLLQFIRTKQHSAMYVHQIRPIAKQMLVALQGLRGRGIIHTDIKLDNIMLKNNENTSQLKLIDFGLAIPASAVICGMKLQPIGCRAPEVSLGLPFSEAIDMWGLGCMLASLYLDYHLFPTNCEYLEMQSMVELFGVPPGYQLRRGVHTKRFFCEEEDGLGTKWRLLTAQEYSADDHATNAKEWPTWRPHFKSLDDLLHAFNEEDAEEFKDRKEFIDFLKKVLHPDGEKRICPTEALQHPFITMSHLSQDVDSSDYLIQAHRYMSLKSTDADMDEDQEVQMSPDHLLPANSWESVEVHVSQEPFDKVQQIPADWGEVLHYGNLESVSSEELHDENLKSVLQEKYSIMEIWSQFLQKMYSMMKIWSSFFRRTTP